MTSSLDSKDVQLSENETITIIDPQKGWNVFNFPELWAYRELVIAMIMRDIKVRYKQTIMGITWAVIQPITMMLIFTLIFGRLAKIPSDGFPYPVFVFSGMLAWNFFSASVSTAGVSLISNANLVSKVYFPRIIIPIANMGVSFVDFLVAAVILFGLLLFYDIQLTYKIIYLPVFLGGLALVSVGVGSWLAGITVAYRDFRYVITYMLQIWMYLTPVIYPISFVPENWRWLLYLNPMYGWINGIRACFLNQPLDLIGLFSSLSISILIFVIGVRHFQKSQKRFADII